MLTISCLLALSAFIATIVSLMGKCPLSVPVLLVALVQVLQCLPLR